MNESLGHTTYPYVILAENGDAHVKTIVKIKKKIKLTNSIQAVS